MAGLERRKQGPPTKGNELVENSSVKGDPGDVPACLGAPFATIQSSNALEEAWLRQTSAGSEAGCASRGEATNRGVARRVPLMAPPIMPEVIVYVVYIGEHTIGTRKSKNTECQGGKNVPTF